MTMDESTLLVLLRRKNDALQASSKALRQAGSKLQERGCKGVGLMAMEEARRAREAAAELPVMNLERTDFNKQYEG